MLWEEVRLQPLPPDMPHPPGRHGLTEAYKKAHGAKKRAPAGIREAKVEVDKDELSKLMSVGTDLAKEIQEIKRNWVPRSDIKNKENDQNKDNDKEGRKRGKKKGVNEVDAEENTPPTKTDKKAQRDCRGRKARSGTRQSRWRGEGK